jgi:hypothetical protein
MEVPQSIAGWFMENPSKMDDLEVPPLLGKLHLNHNNAGFQ